MQVYRVVDRSEIAHYVAEDITEAIAMHQDRFEEGYQPTLEEIEITEMPGHKLLTVVRDGAPSGADVFPRGVLIEQESNADGPVRYTATADYAGWAGVSEAGLLTTNEP